MSFAAPSNSKKMYCRECWREEFFKPQEIGPILVGLRVILSLGLSMFFWPCRCVTCGTKRYANRLTLNTRRPATEHKRLTDDVAC